MGDTLACIGLVCVGLMIIRLKMSAMAFRKMDKAESNKGWSVLAFAAEEPLRHMLVYGVIYGLSYIFADNSLNEVDAGIIHGAVPVTILMISCTQLTYKAIKHQKLTLYVKLSIARIVTAALSLSALGLFMTFDDTVGYDFGGISIYIACVTVLLTFITMCQSWQQSKKVFTYGTSVYSK